MKIKHLFPYEFKDPKLMETALDIHSVEGQRLEWLGDRVLSHCVSLLLYQNNPQRSEAELSRAYVRLVNNMRLQGFGKLLELPELNLPRRSRKAMSDVIEALYGAVMLDGGLEAALKCARHMYGDLLEHPDPSLWARDPKTLLKESCEHALKPQPKYEATSVPQGFSVKCRALGLSGYGHGRTKVAAEMDAALEIVTALSLDEEEAGSS